MPPITTLLFDCDNTLVLSEELAFEACADLVNEILEEKKIEKRYTGPNLMVDYVGQNFRGMLIGVIQKFSLTMSDEDVDKYVQREMEAVIAKLVAKAEPCAGALQEVERLHGLKKYKLSVVSSSAGRRVEASLKKFGFDKYVAPTAVFSAATSLPVPTSKPDPAVYIHACDKLGVKPGECAAVEDSKSGATAAVRAKIPLIGYVGAYPSHEREEKASMLKQVGAITVMYDWKDFDKHLHEVVSAPAVQ